MKEYKLVRLNKKVVMSTDKDLMNAEAEIQQYADEGWELMQLISHQIGEIVGLFVREKQE